MKQDNHDGHTVCIFQRAIDVEWTVAVKRSAFISRDLECLDARTFAGHDGFGQIVKQRVCAGASSRSAILRIIKTSGFVNGRAISPELILLGFCIPSISPSKLANWNDITAVF